MAGFDPEKYAAQKLASSGFDPEKYAAQKLGVSPASDEIVNEMPEELSLWTRFVAKNGGNDPEAVKKYLTKQTGLEAVDRDGEYYLKGKDGKLRPVDPKVDGVGSFFKDLPNDLTDVAYDAADALGTGAATAAGGLAGITAGGIGAVPAAMAAGGAASGASEYLRQKLGKLAGIDQNTDWKDVGTSAAFGTVSPLLFGTGTEAKVGAKKLLANAASKGQQLGVNEAEKMASDASRGLFKRAWDGIPAGLGFLSGKGSESVKDLKAFLPEVDQAVEANLTDSEIARRLIDKGRQTLDTTRSKVGTQLFNDIKAAGRKVDYDSAVAPINDEIKRLEQKALEEMAVSASGEATPVTMAQLEKAIEVKKNYFGDITGQVDAPVIWNKQQQLREVTRPSFNGEGLTNKLKDGTPVDTQMLRNAAQASDRAINDALEVATQGLSTEGKSKYSALKKVEDVIDPFFKDDKTTINTLKNMEKARYQTLRDILPEAKELGVDIVDDVRKSAAQMNWKNPEFFAGGNILNARNFPAGALGASAGYALGANSDMGRVGGMIGGGAIGALLGGPKAAKFYIRAMNAAEKQALRTAPVKQALEKAYINNPGVAKGIWDMMRGD